MGTTHRHASTAQAVLLEDWYQTNGVASSGEVAPPWQEAFQEAFQGRWEGELASFLLPCGFPSCPSCCHDHHDIATNLSWGLAKPRKKNHSDKFYSCMPKPTQIKMYLGGEFPVVVVFISLPFTTIVSIMLIFTSTSITIAIRHRNFCGKKDLGKSSAKKGCNMWHILGIHTLCTPFSKE